MFDKQNSQKILNALKALPYTNYPNEETLSLAVKDARLAFHILRDFQLEDNIIENLVNSVVNSPVHLLDQYSDGQVNSEYSSYTLAHINENNILSEKQFLELLEKMSESNFYSTYYAYKYWAQKTSLFVTKQQKELFLKTLEKSLRKKK